MGYRFYKLGTRMDWWDRFRAYKEKQLIVPEYTWQLVRSN